MSGAELHAIRNGLAVHFLSGVNLESPSPSSRASECRSFVFSVFAWIRCQLTDAVREYLACSVNA